MISLAQTALMGISAYMLGNIVTQGGAGGQSKGLTLGWDPTLALVLALVITTAIGVAFGAVAARSIGIYFLMLTLTYGVIANYFFGQVTQFGGFSPIAGIDQYTPGFVGDIVGHPDKLYYIAFGVALAGLRLHPLSRPDAVRALACRVSATTRSAWLARLQRAAAPHARFRLRRVLRRARRESSSSGGRARSHRATSASARRSSCS